MPQEIDEAMRSLNCALCARKVYWAEHPSAIEPLQSAATLLAGLLKGRESIVIVGLQDRVIADEAELTCGPDLLTGIFAILRSRGTQSIAFLRGVSVGELGKFLDQLVLKEKGGVLDSSKCIRLGCLTASPKRVDTKRAGHNPASQIPRLKDLWAGLMHKGMIDRSILDLAAENSIAGAKPPADAPIMLAGLQTHEDYTFVHTTNVAILSAALGNALGLPGQLVHELTIAALLHDVGKRRVPKEVLNKSSSLSTSEFSIVERHPSDGAAMLFGIKELPAIAAIVAYEHHMHPDGTGYPRIKIGRQMQLSSQIVQIADVFDALRSNRPFRPGLTFDEARAVMYKDVRRFYAPDLLNTFFASVAQRVEHLGSAESTRVARPDDPAKAA